MDKIVICDDLACAFRWNDEFNQLETSPILKDKMLDLTDWGIVEDYTDEEIVTYKGHDVPLNDVFRDAERTLGVAK